MAAAAKPRLCSAMAPLWPGLVALLLSLLPPPLLLAGDAAAPIAEGAAPAASAAAGHAALPASDEEVRALRELQLVEATALHDQAVTAEVQDVEVALALYRQALRVRPVQWESSLRLGTLLMAQPSSARRAEAEATLRYTVNLSSQRAGVEQCAPRTNLGVLLTELAFEPADDGGPERASLASAATMATEALAQFDVAVRAGNCNIARMNAGRLLLDAAKVAPLPGEPDPLGLVGASAEALRGAARKQYAAALTVALQEDEVDTIDGAARKYAQLRPGAGDLHPGSELGGAPQHAIVGRAAFYEGDIEGAKFHTDRALRVDPRSHVAFHTLGLLAERGGNFEESIIAYRSAVAISSAVIGAAAARGEPQRKSVLDATASASNNLGNMVGTHKRPPTTIRSRCI